ncbi:MAG: hypothetical protein U1E26_06545 [Coriobacteriia bacterium]|nr:hypothetical protein [Coriobacteriia bacterium]
MDLGRIIKRSWTITWRYKALWVLGIFAGVSGCSASGGSGSGSSGGSSSSGSGAPWPGGFDPGDTTRLMERLVSLLPLLIAATVLIFFMGMVWSIFAIAARGGLVTGVSSVEDGAPRPLGQLWNAGFARFWTLLGLDILLKLPLFAVGMLMMVLIIVPIFATVSVGGTPGPELIAPVCGSLVVGIPVLLIGGFVLGIMYLIALRYVMLGGQGATEAARNSWRFFRARFKDTVLVWLLNAALNLAASFVIAIPAVVVGLAMFVPLAVSIGSGEWDVLLASIPVFLILFVGIGLAYNAVWGTYTSALWTLFFREAAGMTPALVVDPASAPVASAPPAEYAPAPVSSAESVATPLLPTPGVDAETGRAGGA